MSWSSYWQKDNARGQFAAFGGSAVKDSGESSIRVLLIGADTRFEQLRSFLREMKFPARICADATMARDFALSAAPAVIIVGANVPPFDGAKVIDLLRAERRLEKTPILLLANGGALAGAAADERLSPAITPLEFYEAVSRWMNREPAPRFAAEPAEKGVAPARPAEKAAAPRDESVQQGELKEWAVGGLLYQLAQSPEEHILLVKMHPTKIKVKIGGGKVINIASNYVPAATLGAVLTAEGLLGPAETEAIWVKARKANRRFGEILVDLGLLSAAELKNAVRRQKIAKLRYLVCRPKPEGSYTVRAADPAAEAGASLDLDIVEFLFRTMLKEMPLRMTMDFLGRHEEAGNPLIFSDRVNEHWAQPDVSPTFKDYVQRLNGKSVTEMKAAIPPSDHPAWLRFIHLMVVLGCAWFMERQAFAPPPEPAVKAPPPERRVAPEPRPAPEAPVASPLGPPEPPEPLRRGRPSTPEAAAELIRIAREHLLERRFGEAVSTLHQALRFAPRSAEIAAVWAWTDYCSLTQYDASIVAPIKRRLEKAIEMDETSEWAHLYLGKILKAEKDERGAISHILAASKINPLNEEVEREVTLQQIKQRTRRDMRL